MSKLFLTKLSKPLKRKGPVLNIILDGIALTHHRNGNAFYHARTPCLDALMKTYLTRQLYAHGHHVGMPQETDMGNSEVGHNAIGAGRIFDQGAKIVQKAIEDKSLYERSAWKTIIDLIKKKTRALHFLGLLSDGNVHTHIAHLENLVRRAAADGARQIYLHILTDGRDTPPTSSLKLLKRLETTLASIRREITGLDCRIVSVAGRMVSFMDRYEANWEMVQCGWDLVVEGQGAQFPSAEAGIRAFHREKLNDQYIPPFLVVPARETPGTIPSDEVAAEPISANLANLTNSANSIAPEPDPESTQSLSANTMQPQAMTSDLTHPDSARSVAMPSDSASQTENAPQSAHLPQKNSHHSGIVTIRNDDIVVCFNFRGDRAIEISRAFEDNAPISKKTVLSVHYFGMTLYDGDTQTPKQYLVPPPAIDRTMGEYLVTSGVRLFALSETQKYGHVTYFWNGNRSQPFNKELETYIEIKSADRPLEDIPWMKAAEITDQAIACLQSGKYQFGRINYPNGDMVGHTGHFEACIIAVEAVDLALGRLLEAVKATEGIAIVTADHGNCEQTYELEAETGAILRDNDGHPQLKTSHTLNPVPCIFYDPAYQGEYQLRSDNAVKEAGIAHLAATTLMLLGFNPPPDYLPSLVEWH